MEDLTFGQKLADKAAETLGSWRFIIVQSCLLVCYILWNTLAKTYAFDPFPFIFLNLALSFQAAYAAPIIMIANNRKEQIERERSISIYKLETIDHEHLLNLATHIDQHFEKLNGKIDQNNLTLPPNNIR